MTTASVGGAIFSIRKYKRNRYYSKAGLEANNQCPGFSLFSRLVFSHSLIFSVCFLVRFSINEKNIIF